ncbi:MAG: tetratricopeptide repeat protein [Nitrospinota bacterium]
MKYCQSPSFSPGREIKRSKGKWIASVILSGFLICCLPYTGFGEGPGFEEAVRQAQAGNHAGAEAQYDELLKKKPNSVEYLLGRAYVRSWQKRHNPAQEDFERVLKVDPKNTDALIGMGYNFAWAGKHNSARRRFAQAIDIDSSRVDAKKGLAFTALWQGKGHEAVRRFRKISMAFKDDAEAAVGLGQAYILVGRSGKARKSFKKALEIEPGRKDAAAGIDSLSGLPSKIEISFWAGYTSSTEALGIRSAELGGWYDQNQKIWARYDNALSLDNPGLVRNGEQIPSFFLGGLRNWGKIFTTRLEVGRRDLLEGVNQFLFEGEQVVYLDGGRSLKVGGFIGPRDDNRTDLNVYTGPGIPLSSKSRMEPKFFYTKTGGIDETEWRILLPVEYRFSDGWRTTLHIAKGRVTSEIPNASGSLFAAGMIISKQLTASVEGHVLVKHEAPPLAEDFTVLSFGLTFKSGKE